MSSPRRARRPALAPRTVTMGVSAFVGLALLAALVLMPVPYVVQAPGPTYDTLGEQDGHDLITIDGAEEYPTTGQLRLTTVSVYGGPGGSVNLFQVAGAWLSGDDAVYPEEAIFPTGQTAQEREDQGAVELTTSQEDATVSALTELGMDVPAVLDVAQVAADMGAAGVLQVGDQIVSINGEATPTYQDLSEAMAVVTPGQPAEVGVIRGGEEETFAVTTTDSGGKALLGVGLDPDFDFPVDVHFDIQNIGGPSAGMMFALGIIDKLTEEDLTGGADISGTGTVSPDGTIGVIGGSPQKVRAALRDGADWFLMPSDNCAELAGKAPDGIQVVPVETLHEAREAVESIASGDTAHLPACGG